METQPYGSGNNWFHRTQETLIPTKHQGLPKSYALECIEGISYHANREGTYHLVMVRIYNFALPVFMGASVIELGVVIFADCLVSALGHRHYHYVVDSGQCSLDPVSIREELRELIYHVAAAVLTIIGWLPSMTITPGLYYRKDIGERPKTDQEKAVETAQRLGGVKAQAEQIQREMLIRERRAFLATYPALTPENFDQLSTIPFEGIELRKIEHEKRDFKSSIRGRAEERPEYSQGCWSSPDEIFDPARTRYEEVPVDNPDLYLQPSLEAISHVQVDCTKVSVDELRIFLSKAHRIRELTLIGAPLDALTDLAGLRSIHTLILRPRDGEEIYRATDLSALAASHPNIKVFDLAGCKVDNEVREFNEEHIVIPPTYTGGERRVQAPGVPNLKERHNTFNRKLFEFKQAYDPSMEDGDFRAAFKRVLAEPAATFMTKFAFTGTQLRTQHAKIILECLQETCPYLEVLDFRNSYMLDSEIFSALADFKIKHIYLQGCGNIYYRRAVTDGEHRDARIDKRETLDHPGLHREERQYVLNMHLVTYGLNRLVDNGVERIRLNRVGVGDEREEDIHQAIFTGVYPIIAKWANPRTHSRDVKIYYLNDLSFNGVPLRV